MFPSLEKDNQKKVLTTNPCIYILYVFNYSSDSIDIIMFCSYLFIIYNIIYTQILKSQLFVDKFSERVQHTFLDYLAGGCELNFMVAVDFTSICALFLHIQLRFCCQTNLLTYLMFYIILYFFFFRF